MSESKIELTIVAPAHNEEDNIDGLLDDVDQAMDGSDIAFEMLIVDDGSVDSTRDRLIEGMNKYPWLRVFFMRETPAGKGNGQSAAFHAGLRQADGELIALMDADRQNDPGDLPNMVRMLREQDADMVQGDRSANRRDSVVRKFSSWVGRTFRKVLLGDSIRDTGCSLRVFKREIGLRLPLQYKGLHRFIPFYTRTMGYKVIEVGVNHRPRTAGEAKYGVWNRAIPGLIDLIAVRWMRNRLRPVTCGVVEKNGQEATSQANTSDN